jgi:hypothetical protein
MVSDKPGTEIVIVDSSPAAALALGAHRPSEDSTYVLCRAAGEASAEFSRRVLRRARSIQKASSIGSLWYVIDGKHLGHAGVQLLEELLPLLENGSRLTLASPRSCSGLLFSWVDALLGRCGSALEEVEMGVRFLPDASELRRGVVSQARMPKQQCA